MKSRRSFFILGAIIIAAVLIHVLIKHHRNTSLTKENTIAVEVVRVKQGSIAVEAQAVGTLVAAKNVQISPEVAGIVAKIFFENGGVSVKQGTPLIQLDDADYKAKLASDRANLVYSETDYKRKALLGKEGAISRQMIDQALADMKTKQAAVEQSQVNVNRMLLLAPFDGVTGKINVSPGDYVTVGQKLVSLTDIQHLHVEYAIPEKFLAEIHPGQQVSVISSVYPGKEFTGRVVFVSPTIDMNNRTISLYAEIPNDQKLLTAGLFVNVKQQLGTRQNVLTVPVAALVPVIDGEQVYRIVDNKAVAVPVVTGLRTENVVEIVSGLSSGDMVVVAGQQKLKDGASVQIVQADGKPSS